MNIEQQRKYWCFSQAIITMIPDSYSRGEYTTKTFTLLII